MAGEEAQYDGRRIATTGLSRKQFSINAIANSINYLLMLAIGVWYTPFMLSRLPEEIYGIIPLTTSFLYYMLLIMTVLSASIGRYVTADLSRGDVVAANATFNGFFFGGLKLALAIAVGIGAFCWFLPMRVPAGYENPTRLLAAAVFGSALLLGFCNVFDNAIWSTSRFEIRSIIEVVATVLRNGTVVALYAFTKPDLWQVAIAVSVAAMFQFVTLFAVWKRLTPELRIDRSAMTPETRGIVFTTGGWILVVSLGTALLVSSDLIVISRFFNTGEVAKYAVVVLWASVLRGVFTSLAASVTPSLVALEARGDIANLLAVSSQTIRVSGALCAHCAGVLAGMSVPILTVWLRKPWAADIAPLAWIILFPLCFEVSFYTLLPAILTAKARVRAQAIVSVAIGVFGVILAVILVQVTNLGLYAVALSSGVASLLRYAVVNPIQAGAALPGAGWVFYLRQGAPTALRFAGTALIAYAAARYLQPDHYLTLAGCALAVTAVTLPINYACLPREDHVVFQKLLRIS